MKDEIDNEGVLVRYLLGQLSEEEQQQIEHRAFDDNEFYRQVLEVEDDLRCAYAQGTLPLAQKELFEKRFLIFADERKRLTIARDMMPTSPSLVRIHEHGPSRLRERPIAATSWFFGRKSCDSLAAQAQRGHSAAWSGVIRNSALPMI